jgi:hypothetical protein
MLEDAKASARPAIEVSPILVERFDKRQAQELKEVIARMLANRQGQANAAA